MTDNCFLRPATTHNGSVRTDLPVVVIGKKRRKTVQSVRSGQLLCVGKVYLKTDRALIRLK